MYSCFILIPFRGFFFYEIMLLHLQMIPTSFSCRHFVAKAFYLHLSFVYSLNKAVKSLLKKRADKYFRHKKDEVVRDGESCIKMVTVLCSVKGHPYASSCTLRINSHVLKDTYFMITAANPSSNRNGKVMNYSSLKLLKAEPDDCF